VEHALKDDQAGLGEQDPDNTINSSQRLKDALKVLKKGMTKTVDNMLKLCPSKYKEFADQFAHKLP